MIFGRCSDVASISATSQVATLPIDAVLRDQPRDVWRSTSNADQQITIQLSGAGVSLRGVGILYTNIIGSPSGIMPTWSLFTATTEANLTASPTYSATGLEFVADDISWRYGRSHTFHQLTTTSNSTWLRIDTANLSSSPYDYIEIGRVMLITNFTGHTLSPSYGMQITNQEDLTPVITAGSVWPRVGRRYRQLSLNFPDIDNEVNDTLRAMSNATAYQTTPVMAAFTENPLDKDDDLLTDFCVYGLISNTGHQYVAPDHHIYSLTIDELERP